MHMNESSYRLAEDVYLCLSANRFVFLDLRSDRYLCLDQSKTQAANRLFSGTADQGVTDEDSSTDDSEGRRVLDALARRGLLVNNDKRGKEITSTSVQTAVNSLLNVADSQYSSADLDHWAVFIRASFMASLKLRCYSMQRTAHSVGTRKQRQVKARITDLDALHEAVATYKHLRPFYPRKYLCLYDSLALVEFLAHYRLFPQWVFGVNTEPFGAHCWVQEHDCVLNDTADYVSTFTPIMSI